MRNAEDSFDTVAEKYEGKVKPLKRLRLMSRVTPIVHSDLKGPVKLHHETYLWIILWLNV